jgi:hypothetical protein
MKAPVFLNFLPFVALLLIVLALVLRVVFPQKRFLSLSFILAAFLCSLPGWCNFFYLLCGLVK